MNDLQDDNPQYQFDEQHDSTQQIEEPTASQAIPVNQQNISLDISVQARTISEASSEERKQFLIQTLKVLAVQQIFQLSLALGFAFVEEWGFCSNFFLFLFISQSLDLYIATFKARGIKKQETVMKLQWLGWMICYSFATTLFSTLMNVMYFGWHFYLLFLLTTFLFPIITLGMLIHISSGRVCINTKQYSLIYCVLIFFMDLCISVFNEGYVPFGFLLGEGLVYLYGLYLTFINVQIQYPVNDLSLNFQQEETKFNQMMNLLDRGTQRLSVGVIPNEAQEITMEEIKKQSIGQRLLKLAILQSFCLTFYILPIFVQGRYKVCIDWQEVRGEIG
ncbi:unnamed protein product (macronuclear) [Paramecium tetraurelia]|uniref:Transmembrane protein n=1 Tax=Paramecium tetraurelia TaxID=5888 RepID=A0C180_PARTE|nr:uncharacterized protein GSPATT00034023001 [Paramecium tetraurelia]CAK64547.1 unnamed protein product [Paramecium tetraurelia]|eukprot:XP_001431945.1 hypothetical protein (macronuclear) [Paramecium tetraurelia strain d4-2]